MKTSRHQNVARRKRRIERRLRPRTWKAQPTPMYRANNIKYEHSDRVRGLAWRCASGRWVKNRSNKIEKVGSVFMSEPPSSFQAGGG